jgi:hypothetical protein
MIPGSLDDCKPDTAQGGPNPVTYKLWTLLNPAKKFPQLQTNIENEKPFSSIKGTIS